MRKAKFLTGALALLALAGSSVRVSAEPQKAADPIAGKKLFLQRCSICHMPQAPEPRETLGPHLEGMFQNGDPADVEAHVRHMIETGNAGPPGKGMPSFKYGLDGTQIDNIIAFLKTFKKGDVPKRAPGAGVDTGAE